MKFEVGQQIGQGGMGTVYRARHVDLDRALAVKFIHENLLENAEAVERFLREARTIAKLEHPNIVQVWDAGRDDNGRPYILMELLEGESVRERLRRGRMTESEALDVAKQVLCGLAEAHSKDVIHRDIKPANIFITRTGRVKILDFGIAKALGQSQVTRAGLHVGTPEYMSPEQAEGRPVDKRTDLYSVGIVLYEMVTGIPPFRADTPAGVLYKQVHVPPPPPPSDWSKMYRTAVETLLAKAAWERPEDANEALTLLEGKGSKKGKPSAKERKTKVKPGAEKLAKSRDTTETGYFPATASKPRNYKAVTYRDYSKLKKLVVGLCIIGVVGGGGYFGYPFAKSLLSRFSGVNLSLRLKPGQKFRVERFEVLTFGGVKATGYDDGMYEVTSARSSPPKVQWTIKKQASKVRIGSFQKHFSPGGTSSCLWTANKPASGWAYPPYTAGAEGAKLGETETTAGGAEWKLTSVNTVAGRQVADVVFASVPTVDLMLDDVYAQAFTDHLSGLSLPSGKWKFTTVEDKIDTADGIPLQMTMVQTSGKYKLTITTTMTPEGP